MSFSNVNNPQIPEKYDWDDIDVGNNQLNHSQNFFSIKHNEHERPYEMEFLPQAEVEVTIEQNQSSAGSILIDEDKENIPKLTTQLDVENNENNFTAVLGVDYHVQQIKNTNVISPVALKNDAQGCPETQLQTKDKTMLVTSKLNVSCDWSTKQNTCNATARGAIPKAMPPSTQAHSVKDINRNSYREMTEQCRAEEDRTKHKDHEKPYEMELLHQALDVGSSDENFMSPVKVKKETQDMPETQLETEDKTKLVKSKLKVSCESFTKQNSCIAAAKGAISKAMPPAPQAYLVKDIYIRNREIAEHRRAEEDRKKREFHSRPVPKFTVHHKQLEKRKPVHALTVAVTPQVLKTSREADEKRRKRLEEWKLNNQPPKFKPRLPTILKEKPFVPEKKTVISQPCPFKLNTEKRLRERKQYDEEKHKTMEEKLKQEEEERKKREEERIKELRKATTFKARPNPFKN